jgi:ABC-2 family transporter
MTMAPPGRHIHAGACQRPPDPAPRPDRPGVVNLGLALSWLNVAWSVPRVLVALSAIVAGVVIFTAIWVIGAAITFWTIEDIVRGIYERRSTQG